MKHHTTKYHTDGKHYSESWYQINVFGRIFIFFDKVTEL